MSRREERREERSYHDSRRYLKRHPPRLSDPLFGLRPREDWITAVRQVIHIYPRMRDQREEELRAGGVSCGRRGRSAEWVLLRQSTGPVEAVEAALRRLSRPQRRRIREICFEGGSRCRGDKPLVDLFQRYVAAYLGYGRERYDCRSF